jgi:RNA polymerase sigma-70 factor (ECF subfamily)
VLTGLDADETDALEAEARLVASAKDGDRDAYKQLYVLHLAAVRSFVARRAPRSEVDDLTAETFARAFQHLGTFTWQGVSTRAWLLRIAERQVLGRARRKSSTEVVSDTLADDGVLGHEDSIVDRMEAEQLLGSALGTLTELQRTVLRLRFVDERPVADVAASLGIGDDAVRALAYRGLCTLRSALGPGAATPEPRVD